jgi:hypothetical protein
VVAVVAEIIQPSDKVVVVLEAQAVVVLVVVMAQDKIMDSLVELILAVVEVVVQDMHHQQVLVEHQVDQVLLLSDIRIHLQMQLL